MTDTPLIVLTERAGAKVRELLEAREDAADLALRVYISGGGCSGLSYGMAFDHVRDDDLVVEEEGIKVVLDPQSARFLKGSRIDFKDALTGGGFAIENPNAVRTCGCGRSFKTADDDSQPDPC
ncbi:MAG TPA: iron-sulfur cluster insertion protein ErpA [Limnochordia bacterium]